MALLQCDTVCLVPFFRPDFPSIFSALTFIKLHISSSVHLHSTTETPSDKSKSTDETNERKQQQYLFPHSLLSCSDSLFVPVWTGWVLPSVLLPLIKHCKSPPSLLQKSLLKWISADEPNRWNEIEQNNVRHLLFLTRYVADILFLSVGKIVEHSCSWMLNV